MFSCCLLRFWYFFLVNCHAIWPFNHNVIILIKIYQKIKYTVYLTLVVTDSLLFFVKQMKLLSSLFCWSRFVDLRWLMIWFLLRQVYKQILCNTWESVVDSIICGILGETEDVDRYKQDELKLMAYKLNGVSTSL